MAVDGTWADSHESGMSSPLGIVLTEPRVWQTFGCATVAVSDGVVRDLLTHGCGRVRGVWGHVVQTASATSKDDRVARPTESSTERKWLPLSCVRAGGRDCPGGTCTGLPINVTDC